jgi:hypothetical protein
VPLAELDIGPGIKEQPSETAMRSILDGDFVGEPGDTIQHALNAAHGT